MRKLKKLDEKFIQCEVNAEKHIVQLTKWLDDHKTLSSSDNNLVISLIKKAMLMRSTTTQSIENALNEVIAAVNILEDENQGSK